MATRSAGHMTASASARHRPVNRARTIQAKGAGIVLSLRSLTQTAERWTQFRETIDQFGAECYSWVHLPKAAPLHNAIHLWPNLGCAPDPSSTEKLEPYRQRLFCGFINASRKRAAWFVVAMAIDIRL